MNRQFQSDTHYHAILTFRLKICLCFLRNSVKYLQMSMLTDMDFQLLPLLEEDFYMTSEAGKLQVFLRKHRRHILAK